MSERTSVVASIELDDQYHDLEAAVSGGLSKGPLFETDADPIALWNAYLIGIQEDKRQHYNCHCCRRFLQSAGGLVRIDENGRQYPALWQFDAPMFFAKSVSAIRRIVDNAKVVGVYLSSEKVVGVTNSGGWSHLAAMNYNHFSGGILTASQASAEKLEDYKMLCRGLADYSRETVEQAVRVLKADAVYRSEKALSVAEWFLKLHESIKSHPQAKRNLTWVAVASAPPGFCHVRSTMISTLLDDIKAGLPFDGIARRWKDKMHPLQYQRPTAAPKEGAIKQAEELVEKLGLERSFERRYATLDDVLLKLWVPREAPVAPSAGGIFDHLRQNKKADSIELPAVKITWEKFKKTVLEGVLQMEILVPSHGGFCGLMTAVDPESPAIIQWDGLGGHARNPASWYFWNGGSSASSWGLSAGWNKVSCVFPNPSKWQDSDKFKHQKNSIHFAIPGCVESRTTCLGLFPEIMKAEFHGIRSVIEAHSNRAKGHGAESGNANGLTFDGGSPISLRVLTISGLENYIVDRMD